MRPRVPHPDADRRRGVVVLEFIVAFPLIVIATLGVFEFAFFALVQQAATTAVIEAARQAARIPPDSGIPLNDGTSNADPDDEVVAQRDVGDRVALVVEQFLAIHRLEVEPSGAGDDLTRPNVRVLVERRVGFTPPQIADRGDVNVPCFPPSSPLRPDEVRVTVCFRLVNTTGSNVGGNPVPDWLAPFGVSLGGHTFQLSARASLE